MQCLTKYALHPTFLDQSFSMAIKLAQETIDHLNQSINKQLDIAMTSKVNLDVDRILESIRCKELQDLINRVEDEARAKSSSKAEKGSSKASERANKGKKTAQKHSASRVVKSASPCPEEEQDAAPLLHKRKRSSPVKKVLTSTTSPSFILDAGNEKFVASKMMSP